MQLDTVRIEGFRSIESSLEITVASPTVLAGRNDAGKTALLDAVQFLLDASALTERDRTYGPSGPDGAPTRVSETIVEGAFVLSTQERVDLGLPKVIRLRRTYRDSGTVLELLTDVPLDKGLRDVPSMDVKTLKERLTSLGLATTGNKSDLVARLNEVVEVAAKTIAWVTAPSAVKVALPRVERFNAASTQNPEAAILATLRTSYKNHMDDPQVSGTIGDVTAKLQALVSADAESLRTHIKNQCDDVGEISIHPSIRLDSGLRETEVSALNSRGEAIHLGQSGTGRSRRIALAVWEFNADLLKAAGDDTVLLYDEPDTHLDYSHQRGFMALLEEQSELRHVKSLIATHSMNLIDGVDISRVVHLRHENERTIADVLIDDTEVGEHLGAIAASLGLRNTVLLHERLFVGVEGATESKALPVLFKIATGRHLQTCGIALWPCDNNDGALRFAQYLRAHNREVRLVVDQDSLDLKMFSEPQLNRHSLSLDRDVLTIGTRELEDTFTDAQWAACANSTWPREDRTQWLEGHFSAHRAGKFSTEVERMIREHSGVQVSGKPAIMTGMALSLTAKDEIPEKLHALFAELIAIASY